MSLLRVENLTCVAAGRALHDLDFDLEPGACLALIAGAGAGKTLLADLLAAHCVHRGPVDGVTLDAGSALSGMDVETFSGRIVCHGRASCFAADVFHPCLPLEAQFAAALRAVDPACDAKSARARMLAALAALDIEQPEALLAAHPHEVQPGRLYRAALALTLLGEPDLLILDDVDGASRSDLSANDRLAILRALHAVRRRFRPAVLCLTQDEGFAARLASLSGDRCVWLRAGRLESEPAPLARGLSPAAVEFAVADAAADAPDFGPPLLELRALSKSHSPSRFGDRLPWRAVHRPLALNGVSFSLAARETVALIGEAGSGKSTLAGLLLRTLAPGSGEIRFRGETLPLSSQALARQVQGLFALPGLDPRQKVRTLFMSVLARSGLRGRSDLERRMLELLERAELEAAVAACRGKDLEVDVAQRVALALAFAATPRLLVCDEADAALDDEAAARLRRLLLDFLTHSSTACLWLTRSLDSALEVGRRVGVLHQGCLVEMARADCLLAAPAHPYTEALLLDAAGLGAHVPEPASRVRKLPRTPGCVYFSRCPRKTTVRCPTLAPDMVTHPLDSEHSLACHQGFDASEPAHR